MKREHLLDTLRAGEKIAKEYDKLESKYNRAKKPVFLSFLVFFFIFSIIELIFYSKTSGLSIFSIVKNTFTVEPEQLFFLVGLNVILLLFLMYIPLMKQISSLFMKLVGLCFYFKKQKRLKRELEIKLKQYFEATHIPEIYCDSRIMEKFIKYIETHQADTIKECVRLYLEEDRHEKMINELKKLKQENNAGISK